MLGTEVFQITESNHLQTLIVDCPTSKSPKSERLQTCNFFEPVYSQNVPEQKAVILKLEVQILSPPPPPLRQQCPAVP